MHKISVCNAYMYIHTNVCICVNIYIEEYVQCNVTEKCKLIHL